MEHRRNYRILNSLIFILLVFLTSCTKELIGPLDEDELEISNPAPTLNITTTTFTQFSLEELGAFYNVNGRFHFTQGNQEYFIYVSNYKHATYLFKRVDTNWILVDVDRTNLILDSRNYSIVDDYTFIIGSTGEDTRPVEQWGSWIYEVKVINDKISIRKISELFGYWHSISTGDLTGDGLYDVVSMGWLFIQNPDHSFTPHYLCETCRDGYYTKNVNQYQGNTDLFDLTRMNQLKNPMEPLIVDLFPGGRPELVMSYNDHTGDVPDNAENEPFGQVLIYEYSEQTKRYELVYEITRKTIGFRSSVQSMQMGDLNKDGINDLVLESVPYDDPDASPIEVWLGKSNKSFYKNQTINIEVATSQISLFDVNEDGYDDVVLRPRGDGGNFYRNDCTGESSPTCDELIQQGITPKDGVFLYKTFYLNSGNGTFYQPSKDDLTAENIQPVWLMPFKRNGNLVFFGNDWVYHGDTKILELRLIDIEINKNKL